MNPSAFGWIKKLNTILEDTYSASNTSLHSIYTPLRNSGFIYGTNVSVLNNIVPANDLNEEELCKINLFCALFYTHKQSNSAESLPHSIISFYTKIEDYRSSFIKDLLGSKNNTHLLENIIHKRVLIDDNLLTKNFNYFITNAFLFIDVLAYNSFLKQHTISVYFIKRLESIIETVVINILNSKLKKSTYDTSLLKLFEKSIRHDHKTPLTYNEAILKLKSPMEAQYIIDMASMASWNDAKIDKNEFHLLHALGSDLNCSKTTVNEAIDAISYFFLKHKNNHILLSSKNLVKTFYDNSTKTVSKLISRNSKRLVKELKESKELVKLLSKSTIRDLNEDEQKRVQDQLIDIFKTIPSLALFLLPGGAFLLPLVIKFIPKLLPSAFDDNRIEEYSKKKTNPKGNNDDKAYNTL